MEIANECRVALALDAIDLADALDIDNFAVVGHDWRVCVAFSAVTFPEKLRA
jgi:pimeloyl-ACP methyl ester carboxylesterase